MIGGTGSGDNFDDGFDSTDDADSEAYDLILEFPDPRSATDEGLLCVGGDLEVETLVAAYSGGIFPWPHPGYPLLWFSPPERGIIDFTELHIPKSLQKELRRPHDITFDKDFEQVIENCARAPRPKEAGTWILPEMKQAYLNFHKAGYAHSAELWEEGELIGGVYGVLMHGVFSGESMFFKKPNASKICLLALIQRLKSGGLTWMDTQMVTPVVEQLGGKYISRDQFLDLLKFSQAKMKRDKLSGSWPMEEPVKWSEPWEGFK